MTFGIVSWVGVMVASASTVIYGEPIWNPLGMLTRMLDDTPYDSATRAGVFFISASFILAQLGTNIAANSELLSMRHWSPTDAFGNSYFCGYRYDRSGATILDNPTRRLHSCASSVCDVSVAAIVVLEQLHNVFVGIQRVPVGHHWREGQE